MKRYDRYEPRPIAPREPPRLDSFQQYVADLWWERGRHYEREGRKWTETRTRKGKDGAEDYEAPMYEPVLDIPAIESVFRIEGIRKVERPKVLMLFEALFHAERRKWTQQELNELVEQVARER